jgi:hypothetical protein
MHSMAAIVVTPDLVTQANVQRSIRQGKFKIYVSVDLPRGELYNHEKFRGVPTEALQADGYEILLTPRQSEHEVFTEARYLTDFIRNYVTGAETRFIMDAGQSGRGGQYVTNVLTACKKIPMPALVRTTHLTRIPPSTSTIEVFTKHLAEYRSICAVPIKISGNIDRSIYEKVNAHRFGVSLQQAQLLIKEEAPKAAASIKPAEVPA